MAGHGWRPTLPNLMLRWQTLHCVVSQQPTEVISGETELEVTRRLCFAFTLHMIVHVLHEQDALLWGDHTGSDVAKAGRIGFSLEECLDLGRLLARSPRLVVRWGSF